MSFKNNIIDALRNLSDLVFKTDISKTIKLDNGSLYYLDDSENHKTLNSLIHRILVIMNANKSECFYKNEVIKGTNYCLKIEKEKKRQRACPSDGPKPSFAEPLTAKRWLQIGISAEN